MATTSAQIVLDSLPIESRTIRCARPTNCVNFTGEIIFVIITAILIGGWSKPSLSISTTTTNFTYFLDALRNQVGQYLLPINKPILVIAPNLEIASQLERQILISPDDPRPNFICSKRGILPRERIDALPRRVKIEETNQLTIPFYLQNHGIIIANAQKFLSGVWETKQRDDLFQVVIVDEAHHFPAPTWRRIINKFSGRALIAVFYRNAF